MRAAHGLSNHAAAGGAALTGGLAALTLLPLGLLGTLGTCGALLAAVGAVMTEKFRNDSRMLADEADELPRLSLELPHRTAPWSGGSRERTSRTDVSHKGSGAGRGAGCFGGVPVPSVLKAREEVPPC